LDPGQVPPVAKNDRKGLKDSDSSLVQWKLKWNALV